MRTLNEEIAEVEGRLKFLRGQLESATCAKDGCDIRFAGGCNAGCEIGSGCGCSVPVYTCRRCGDSDYGDNAEASDIRENCRRDRA